ncbi:hypothetical protein B0H19DRAFT_1064618 [Mycena capillaripes]|nr:hypothetical protein B0H19DRAFT_1064618 [Mycena capillaripes]
MMLEGKCAHTWMREHLVARPICRTGGSRDSMAHMRSTVSPSVGIQPCRMRNLVLVDWGDSVPIGMFGQVVKTRGKGSYILSASRNKHICASDSGPFPSYFMLWHLEGILLWILMPPLGRPNCCPPVWPEVGHEDIESFCVRGGRIYVVSNGTRNGLYTSESRARKQVEGISNGRWRKAKSWTHAIELWNEACDAYHELKCPLHPEASPVSRAVPSIPAPTGPQEICAHNAKVIFNTGNPDRRFKTTWISESQALTTVRSPPLHASPRTPPRTFQVASSSASAPPSRDPYFTPTHQNHFTSTRPNYFTPTRLKTHSTQMAPPSSPLAMMDAVEAFSRMGVIESSTEELPIKQWVVAGVPKFFAERVEAIDHVIVARLPPTCIMGSRNVNKLRVFAKGEKYVMKQGDIQYLDDEFLEDS